VDLFYYVPNRKRIGIDDLPALNLSYAYDVSSPSYAETMQGPDDKHGVVFVFGEGAPQRASTATWRQIPDSEAWVGYDPKDPPKPSDLRRRKTLPGHPVELADGNTWTVPVARHLNGVAALPRSISWDGKDWTPGDVLPKYADLFAQACMVWDELEAEFTETAKGGDAATTEFTLSTGCDIAVMALAINYRLGPTEVSMLGLFDTTSQGNVVLALVDWPMIEILNKKKAIAEPESLTHGEEG